MKYKIYKGAFILGVANILVKVLGLFFIFPFAKMVGPSGTSLFTYAYIPFVFFMDFSTLGVIPGVSKIISSDITDNNEGKALYLLKKGRMVLFLIGFIAFILINIFAGKIATMVIGGNIETQNSVYDVTLAIRCVSPSLLIGPVVALYRGFFQGTLTTLPSAVSIVLEQIVRIAVILGGAYVIIHLHNKEYHMAVNLAVLSASFGLLASFIFLHLKTLKYKNIELVKYPALKRLFRVCIPFGITTVFLSLNQTIDAITFNRLLITYGEQQVEQYFSTYLFEIARLIIIPIIISQAFASSLMPNLNAMQDADKKHQAITKAINAALIIGVISTFLFSYLSNEIYDVFYENYSFGGKVLKNAAILILLYGLNKIIIAIMQAVELIMPLVALTIIAVLLKYCLNITLIAKVGYIGAIIATAISCIFIIFFSLAILRRKKIITWKFVIGKSIKNTILATISLFLLIIYRFFFQVGADGFFNKTLELASYFIIYLGVFYILSKIIKFTKIFK